MVTTLYLVRHGETEGGDVKRYKGSIDVPLSERGISQIKESAAFIKDHVGNLAVTRRIGYLKEVFSADLADGDGRLTAVYCSGLSRAVKSAELIAEGYGLRPVIVHDLRERNFGAWEGMSFAEIKERYPDEFNSWASDPLRFSPVGGESTLEVRDRTVEALESILAAHEGSRSPHNEGTVPDLRTKQIGVVESGLSQGSANIAIVAHGGVNRVLLCHVMGIPLENVFRVEQDFAAVNIIEFWDKYPVVKLVNGGRNG